jgi:hypothetical protein
MKINSVDLVSAPPGKYFVEKSNHEPGFAGGKNPPPGFEGNIRA